MLYIKKIEPGKGDRKPKPIDIAWVIFIGIAKLGYTEKEVYLMPFGKWMDLFSTYKNVYNFEASHQLYGGQKEEKKGSVMDL